MVTLDHFMRALWQKHGKPGGKAPGYVDVPYTMADLKAALASVAGDAAFADDFFARFIQGREVVNYEPLLARAGLALRLASPGRAFAGEQRLLDLEGRLRVRRRASRFARVSGGTRSRRRDPGAGEGQLSRTRRTSSGLSATAEPGDEVPFVFERRGERLAALLRLVGIRGLEIVRAEDIGRR